jgi:hypothetical protein
MAWSLANLRAVGAYDAEFHRVLHIQQHKSRLCRQGVAHSHDVWPAMCKPDFLPDGPDISKSAPRF